MHNILSAKAKAVIGMLDQEYPAVVLHQPPSRVSDAERCSSVPRVDRHAYCSVTFMLEIMGLDGDFVCDRTAKLNGLIKRNDHHLNTSGALA